MTSSPPRRRFLPEPMETTSRSSKRPHPTEVPITDTPAVEPVQTDVEESMAPSTKPRRFLPQPVEESTKSSRKNNTKHVENTASHTRNPRTDLQPIYCDDPTLPGIPNTRSPDAKPRHFAPEPVETSSRSSRRKFAPEPIETSSRSSKDKLDDSSTKPRRKFAPDPVEITTRSSKDKQEEETAKPRRRFLPEPVETETRSRRKKDSPVQLTYSAEDGPAVASEPSSAATTQAPSRTSSGNRKFSPELLETAKGRFRHAVVKSPSKPKDPEPESDSPPPEQEAADHVPPIEESKFSAASLAKKHREENRRRSFMVPDLPMIESDSGSDSEAPSLTNSRSSAESELPKSAKRAAGDSYTDYVLRLASQSATAKELQDQAMAAYINERTHEPVAHYGFDDDEDDGTFRVGKLSGERGVDIRTFRRSSQDDLDWELQNMRKHHEQLEKMKREFKHDVAGASRFSAAALATRHHIERKEKKAKKPRGDEDSDMAKMRAAASPPMLGSDLVFPYTISPKMTRCDTDQAPRPRTYDSDDDEEDEEPDNQELWGAKVNVHQNGLDGLWMGMCQRNHEEASRPTTPIRSGIQTPVVEVFNPFDAHTPGRKTPGRRGQQTPGRKGPKLWGAVNYIPLTPPRSGDGDDAFTSSIDKKLLLEKQIEEEFPDGVITQIYNYLSLGYPSLAWAFDEELGKISRVSVEELRRDDQNADANGYVGVPEGDGIAEEEVRGKCKRWEALRIYVREWARQSPGFATQEGVGQGVAVGNRGNGWGGNVAVRKGSWGH